MRYYSIMLPTALEVGIETLGKLQLRDLCTEKSVIVQMLQSTRFLESWRVTDCCSNWIFHISNDEEILQACGFLPLWIEYSCKFGGPQCRVSVVVGFTAREWWWCGATGNGCQTSPAPTWKTIGLTLDRWPGGGGWLLKYWGVYGCGLRWHTSCWRSNSWWCWWEGSTNNLSVVFWATE